MSWPRAHAKSVHHADPHQSEVPQSPNGRQSTANDFDGLQKWIVNGRASLVHRLGYERMTDDAHKQAKAANSGHSIGYKGPFITNIVIDSDDKQQTSNEPGDGFFSDGHRRVDFVLVYEYDKHSATGDTSGHRRRSIDKDQQRAFFERNLIEAGLNLEEDTHVHESGLRFHTSGLVHNRSHTPQCRDTVGLDTGSGNNHGHNLSSTVFVKVHAPLEALYMQAEKLKLKMPLKLTDPHAVGPTADKRDDQAENVFIYSLRYLKDLLLFKRKKGDATGLVADPSTATFANGKVGSGSKKAPLGNRITWPFSRKRIELFDLGDDPATTFFTPTQRLEIVWNMLQQARNDPEDEKRRGIERLLEKGIYEKAFALHDGKCTRPAMKGSKAKSNESQRDELRHIWAGWRCTFRRQPIGLIRSYFGEKAGFYFAFLGFYTKMLIFPTIFGVSAVLYGMFNPYDDAIVKEVCDGSKAPGNLILCPLCQPPYCHFHEFSYECDHIKWHYRMDNEATLVVACLTVFWSVCMLKMWKRKEAELAYQWDTYDVGQEMSVIRPEYEERAPAKRLNPITKEMEPFVPPVAKACWLLASACITLVILCIVGAILAALVFSRIALYGVFRPYIYKNVLFARMFVHGLIFIAIFIFEKLYHDVAHKLTSLECPRTQTAWLSSFLWKVFVFELLIDFVIIAYAAWVKGRIVHTPLDLNWHTELCDPGGCMGEVTELTAMLLLLRLVVGNAAEFGWPLAKNFYKRFLRRRQEVSLSTALHETGDMLQGTVGAHNVRRSRWHDDYLLNDLELDGVAEDYMEMMIQFAFCTLFVPAFPLAPLICLVNNIMEIRIDAIKFTRATRRLIPVRVAGIQIWNEFLSIISKLAIIFNAGLIAFTSTIVPRLYYKYSLSPIGSYENYTTFSVSKIHRSAWQDKTLYAFKYYNISECYYEDYRKPDPPYEREQHWWQVACMRLAAFAGFALLGFTFEWVVNFVVDDTPSHVTLAIERRRYYVTKSLEAYEENRAKAKRSASGRVAETAVHAGPSNSDNGYGKF